MSVVGVIQASVSNIAANLGCSRTSTYSPNDLSLGGKRDCRSYAWWSQDIGGSTGVVLEIPGYRFAPFECLRRTASYTQSGRLFYPRVMNAAYPRGYASIRRVPEAIFSPIDHVVASKRTSIHGDRMEPLIDAVPDTSGRGHPGPSHLWAFEYSCPYLIFSNAFFLRAFFETVWHGRDKLLSAKTTGWCWQARDFFPRKSSSIL
jgi:hypothetical protein